VVNVISGVSYMHKLTYVLVNVMYRHNHRSLGLMLC